MVHNESVDAALHLEVLGEMRVRRGSELVHVSKVHKALLAALVSRRPRAVSATALAEAIARGGAASPLSLVTVRSHVSRLRGVAGPGVVETVGDRYRMGAFVVSDVATFEQTLRVAERHMAEGELFSAAQSCHDAIALWRGDPYEGFEDHVHAGELHRLTELRGRAFDLRTECLIELGFGSDVIGDLEAVLAGDPLSEHRWAHLMAALISSGRAPEALHAFARARRALGEALGIEPGPALRRLERLAVTNSEPPQSGGPSPPGARPERWFWGAEGRRPGFASGMSGRVSA